MLDKPVWDPREQYEMYEMRLNLYELNQRLLKLEKAEEQIQIKKRMTKNPKEEAKNAPTI